MINALPDYVINEKTMALLSVAHFDYSTIVLETDRQYFVRKTPNQLIASGCLVGGASYEGRRAAVMHQTDWKKKVPIPINLSKNIFSFPTQSLKSFSCHWLFYHHIQSLEIFHSPKAQSIITFKNHTQLPLQESYHILNQQIQRTAICILKFASLHHLIG